MAFRVFISYARTDAQQRDLREFLDDLLFEVRSKSGFGEDQLRFLDTEAIRMGQEWQTQLLEALRTSRICVCLCSQSYLNSPTCGREYQAFLNRRETFVRSQPSAQRQPRIIFPVIWERPSGIPEAISRFQYSEDGFPELYVKEGLRFLKRLDRFKDD